MTDTNRPPLWREIENCDAFMPVHGLLRRRLIAVLIRAVRDWLVPEEEEDPPILGYKPTRDAVVIHAMWKERQRLRALLSTEADRAERGE